MLLLTDFIAGIIIGFVLTFPPRKIQLILVGALAVFVVAGYASLLDSNANLADSGYSWLNFLFNFIGYAFGYVSAYALRKELKVKWK